GPRRREAGVGSGAGLARSRGGRPLAWKHRLTSGKARQGADRVEVGLGLGVAGSAWLERDGLLQVLQGLVEASGEALGAGEVVEQRDVIRACGERLVVQGDRLVPTLALDGGNRVKHRLPRGCL